MCCVGESSYKKIRHEETNIPGSSVYSYLQDMHQILRNVNILQWVE